MRVFRSESSRAGDRSPGKTERPKPSAINYRNSELSQVALCDRRPIAEVFQYLGQN